MKIKRISKWFFTWLRAREEGQSMALLMSTLPALIGLAALGTDVSTYYFNWYQMQKAVDSAVLSGANYLPGSSNTASSTATSYAETDGLASSELGSPSFNGTDTSITLTASRTAPLYLAKIFGLSTGQLRVSATAEVLPVGSVYGGITPIGIQYNTSYTYGQTITLIQGQAPGDWGALSLINTGSSSYLSTLETGYNGTVNVGDQVTPQPGNQISATQTGLDYLIQEGLQVDPSGTFSSHTLSDPRVILVPMVDFGQAGGRSTTVPVDGFAALWVNTIDSRGNITGDFIQQVVPNSHPSTTATSYGAYTVVLSS